MKKILSSLLVAASLVGAMHARTHSNKTFLRPRPVLRNMAMRKTTWHKRINREGDSKFGGSVQVTGFYQESDNRSGLGRYFGAHNPECTKCDACFDGCRPACGGCNDCNLCCKTPAFRSCPPTCDPCDTSCNRCAFDSIQVDNTKDELSTDLVDLASFDVVHNPSAAFGANQRNANGQALPENMQNSAEERSKFFSVNPGGTIQLKPRYNAWGIRFDYYQDLDKLVNGLHFRVSTVVSEVETCMKPRLCGPSVGFRETTLDFTPTNARMQAPGTPLSSGQGVNTDGTVDVSAATFSFGSNNGKTLLDYFSGNFSQTKNPLTSATPEGGTATPVDTNLVQDALCKLRIPCKCDSTTELADIELVLGYNIIHQEDKHIGLNLGVVFPTGNSAKSNVLFEPLSGNGDHWAFGAGFDTAFRLWKNDNFTLDLLLALDYRYLFEGNERRVVGFKGADGKVVNHGWYRLFGQVGESKVFPGANVLCCDLDVEPGSQVDFIAALAFNWGGFTIDLGYNLFAQESEDVCFGSKCCWRNNTYGLIDDNYDPGIFDPIAVDPDGTTIPGFNNRKAINRTDLCLQVAETPSQVTHKLYGGVGYATHMWDFPFMIGAGASYEWVESNAAIEQWAVWGKLSISF